MNIKVKQTLKPIQLQVALVPVCKMVIKLGLHFNEFVRNLQRAYIQAAEEILNEKNISPSLQAIAVKTGMDRRTISEHKNNKSRSYAETLNKMDMIIVQLQKLCLNRENKQLSITELKTIIDSVYANHIRSIAVIRELLSNNYIRQIDENNFKLNFLLKQQLDEISEMADEIDYTAKRLFQTYYRNMFIAKSKKQLLIKNTLVSTQIAPSKIEKVNKLIQNELKDTQNRLGEILIQNSSIVPKNTYPEIGVTFFQFNSEKNSRKQ